MLRIKLTLAAIFIAIAVSSQASILLDKIVAIVNQEVITWSELYKSMEEDAAPQIKELKENERRQVFKDNESTFLESLINVKLQLQEAKNLGIGVTDEELKEGIDNIKKKYSMTESAFLDSLKKEGYTLDEYKKRLREQIMISKVVNVQIRNKIVASEADIKNFLDENKSFAESGEGYRLRQIFFKAPKNDAERGRVEEKAAELLNKLKEGANFSDLARQYSEDSSAQSGGDLGVVKKNHLAKEFIAAVSVMKTGEVSSPFWTVGGLHIVQLNEIIGPKNADEIKEEARTAVVNKMFSERYAVWIKGLREKAYIEIRL